MILILSIILVAAYGLVTANNLIRKMLCLWMLQSSVILCFLTEGHSIGHLAPVLEPGVTGAFVDPMPQALMLTAIVIGVCFNVLAVVFIVRLYETRGTVEVSQLRER